MKIFKNKFLVKLIASICLFLTLLNFGASNKVYAEDDVWGGVLINPITKLMTAIGDAIMEILHDSIQSQDAAIIKIQGHRDWWEVVSGIIAVVAGIIAAVIFIAVISAATAGIAAGAAALAGGVAKAAFTAALAQSIVSTIVPGAIAGVVVGVSAKKGMIPEDIYLPAFSLTAEQIFRNEVHLFDVNFFNPMEDKQVEIVEGQTIEISGTQIISESYNGNTMSPDADKPEWTYLYMYTSEVPTTSLEKVLSTDNIQGDEWTNILCNSTWENLYEMINNASGTNIDFIGTPMQYYIQKYVEAIENGTRTILSIRDDADSDKLLYAIDYYSYDEGKVQSLVVKKDPSSTPIINSITSTDTIVSTASQLQGVVSTWYFILRNLALLILMLLLIYSGIRIVIGSTAGEKAKYKERLMDWLVAICLIFIMHYIMTFAVEIVERITGFISQTVNTNMAYIELTEKQRESADEVLQDFIATGKVQILDEYEGTKYENGVLVWPTDLAGLFRIQSQMTEVGTTSWVGYSLCYVILVLFTLFFAFTYVKRVLYMAFLTIIAPLVAMTYPIDKITDGKAQAFDSWLKEYIFNLMIQPLHLLLYTILVTSAFSLAANSPIYALVAVGFMMPAEKLMRRFFGFEKAKTPGLLGGAAGAAIAMSGLQNIMKHKSHGGKSSSSSEKSKDSDNVKQFKNNTKGDYNMMDGVAEGNKFVEGSEVAKDSNKEKSSDVKLANTTDEPVEDSRWDGDFNSSFGIYDLESNYRDENLNEEIPEISTVNTNITASEDKKVIDTPEDKKDADIPEEKSKRSIKGAAKAVAIGAGKQLAVGVLKGMHPIRLAGKVATGATLGTAGLLLGVASGDPSKAFQYTSAGVVGGAALAGSFSGGKGMLDANELKEEGELAYYGEDYKKHKIEEQKRAFINDGRNIDFIRKTTGASASEAKDILESTGSECYDNGITNMEEILAIHKLTKGKDSLSFKKAMAARDYAEKRLPSSDINKMDKRSIDKYKERWAEEFKDRYKDKITDKQAEQLASEAFNLAVRYNKQKNSLTKL